MAVVFAQDVVDNRLVNLGTVDKGKALYDGLKASLTAAGWTITDGVPGASWMEVSSTPSNGHTFTTGSKTYTMRTTIDDGVDGEITIGPSAANAAANIVAAVNLDPAGAGTQYSSATTQGPARALPAKSDDVIYFFLLDAADNGADALENSNSLVWRNDNTGAFAVEAFRAVSAETSDYLRVPFEFHRFQDTNKKPMPLMFARDRSSVDEVTDERNELELIDNVDWRIISHPYGFWAFQDGSKDDDRNIAVQVLAVPEPMRAKKVTGATNASPIVVTTNVPHGYTTGDTVKIKYVAGNTAANGNHIITAINATSFSLNGTTGTGAFTGADGMVANTTAGKKEILEVAIGVAGTGNLHNTFRDNSKWNIKQFFNGAFFDKSESSTLKFAETEDDGNVQRPWFNGAKVTESTLVALSQDGASSYAWVGQFYNSLITQQSVAMDQVFNDAQGNQWLTLSDNLTNFTFSTLISYA